MLSNEYNYNSLKSDEARLYLLIIFSINSEDELENCFSKFREEATMLCIHNYWFAASAHDYYMNYTSHATRAWP